MTRLSPLHLTALLLATALPLPAAAQTGAIVQPPTPNADRLSEQMRVLGRSPNDVSALVEAGRLSGKLGDTDAAMQFLARAEKVAPNDPRIRAARGVALVGMERPGEALALFASAERAGVNMTPYLAERGLAYDLLGRGSLAQADYRQALRAGDDDEVTRRLALSLGIDGDMAGSTAILNPLLQRGDRAAWRVRAFVLAMSGDAAGADKITASVLPGFSASLSPFFRRLPQLAGADRAFAVHYGRLVPSPERLADARLAPPLPAPVRTAPPVALASATPVAAAAPARTAARRPTYAERRAERQREAQAIQVAQTEATRRAAEARAQQLAQAQAAQAEATRRAADARAQQLAQAQADEAARRAALAQRQLAAQQAEQARIAEATRVEAERVAAARADERRVAAEALAVRDRAEQAARPPVQVAAAPVPVTVVDRPPDAAPAPPAAPVAVAGNPAPATAPAASSAAATVAARRGSNDDVLARIIRNLDIPASELGVGPPLAPVAAPSTLAAEAEAARRAAIAREATARAAEAAEAKKEAAARAATAKKAAEAKRLADEKKAEAAEAARLAQVKRADPERHWVQIAGGANVAGLPAAWGIMAGKAPALKGRQAWTTPLRATNRLLTGPFKSDAEAQDFVNTLRKSGVQAFAFTSEAGQKVVRVPVK
ncbi:SPOR domain-containing protein [Sphingomonas sp. 2R-10]|uniref:SPOR domain-containing protein n=1 Tax=Sphingomonas sp. 2R-10 TaxID=3045148 RepID=UPI0019D2C37D|nr:SPOR domain-containing protein [Sphingomonas sp. 2R-10]MDJ0276690.1 SPOR domain-containing protein [Sphingomonas sp. 2R-10]